MFSLIHGIYQEYFTPPQFNVLIVGGQSVGKTAIMERIKVTDFSNGLSFPPPSSPDHYSNNHSRKMNRKRQQRQQHQQQQQQQYQHDVNDTNNIRQPRNLSKSRFIFFPDCKTSAATTTTAGPTKIESSNTSSNKYVTEENENDENNDVDDENDYLDDENDEQLDHDVDSDNDTYNGDISGDEDYRPHPRTPRRSTRKLLRGRTTNANLNHLGINKDKMGIKSSTTCATATTTTTATSTIGGGGGTGNNNNALPTTTTLRAWHFNFCPAPRKYKKHDDADDDDIIVAYDDAGVRDDTFDHVIDAEQNALLSGTEYNSNTIDNDESVINDSSFATSDDDSMESIEFQDPKATMKQCESSKGTNELVNKPTKNSSKNTKCNNKMYQNLLYEEEMLKEYNIKPGTRMLPLEKIKRTIGMNLTKKLPICSAYVNIWDLGGKLVHLWERYYDDADCVIFVWKINTNDDSDHQGKRTVEDNDDDDDQIPQLTSSQQLELLEQVRSSIPDDIPLLIIGHLFNPAITDLTTSDPKQLKVRQQEQQQQQNEGNNTSTKLGRHHHDINFISDSLTSMNHRRYYKLLQYCRTDKLYSTSALLPSFSTNNNNIICGGDNIEGLYFVDASNGKGIKTAMEWLVRITAIAAKKKRR